MPPKNTHIQTGIHLNLTEYHFARFTPPVASAQTRHRRHKLRNFE